jgi:hypothetical protein
MGYTDGMRYILEYYGEMRAKKTEDAALRACYKKIEEIENE